MVPALHCSVGIPALLVVCKLRWNAVHRNACPTSIQLICRHGNKHPQGTDICCPDSQKGIIRLRRLILPNLCDSSMMKNIVVSSASTASLKYLPKLGQASYPMWWNLWQIRSLKIHHMTVHLIASKHTLTWSGQCTLLNTTQQNNRALCQSPRCPHSLITWLNTTKRS